MFLFTTLLDPRRITYELFTYHKKIAKYCAIFSNEPHIILLCTRNNTTELCTYHKKIHKWSQTSHIESYFVQEEHRRTPQENNQSPRRYTSIILCVHFHFRGSKSRARPYFRYDPFRFQNTFLVFYTFLILILLWIPTWVKIEHKIDSLLIQRRNT
jgi:hypothetical protein